MRSRSVGATYLGSGASIDTSGRGSNGIASGGFDNPPFAAGALDAAPVADTPAETGPAAPSGFAVSGVAGEADFGTLEVDVAAPPAA